MIGRLPAKRKSRGQSSGDADGTRIRLLNSAAEIFAEHGYDDATVRQICERAGANVALVNYYFGDKLELYTEVLRFLLRPGSDQIRADLPPATELEAALRLLIGAMIERAFETSGQTHLRMRLMLNEFVRPSIATARVVDVVMRPVYDRLREIAGAVLGLPADHQKAHLCAHSILGQVAHFAHAKPVLNLLWPKLKMSPAVREIVATHITDFSMAYLKAMAGRSR